MMFAVFHVMHETTGVRFT